jgi:6-phosphogluconolactonase
MSARSLAGPTLPSGVILHAADTSEDMLRAAADHFAARLDTARAVALTGGRTARALYQILARHPHAARWKNVQWFWGDDRFVPLDHADSNAGMTVAALLDPIGAAHRHPIAAGAASAQDAARDYAATLQSFYGDAKLDPRKPLFDLVLLVPGPDGHIASLLPRDAALAEKTDWTAAVAGRDHPRVTLTYPVLESAREVVMIAGGDPRRAMLQGWFGGTDDLPVTAFKPACGITLFADAAALPLPVTT